MEAIASHGRNLWLSQTNYDRLVTIRKITVNQFIATDGYKQVLE